MMPMVNVATIARSRKSVIFRIFGRGENRVVQEEAPCLLPEKIPHCVEKRKSDKQSLQKTDQALCEQESIRIFAIIHCLT